MTTSPGEQPPLPGTTRATALRSNAGFRIGMAVVCAGFAIITLANLRTVLTDTHASPNGLVLGTVAFAVALTVLLVAHTTRVWVQHSFEPGSTAYHQWTLHKHQLGRHSVAHLRSPHVLRIHAPGATGPRPSWRLTVTDPDGRRALTCSAPWLGSLPDLVELLRPAVAGDRRLAADAETRSVLGITERAAPGLFDRDRDRGGDPPWHSGSEER